MWNIFKRGSVTTCVPTISKLHFSSQPQKAGIVLPEAFCFWWAMATCLLRHHFWAQFNKDEYTQWKVCFLLHLPACNQTLKQHPMEMLGTNGNKGHTLKNPQAQSMSHILVAETSAHQKKKRKASSNSPSILQLPAKRGALHMWILSTYARPA